MVRRITALLLVLCCLASCGVSRITSGFSRGDGTIPASFPERTVVHLCESEPSLRLDVIHSLVMNLTNAGVEVANSDNLKGVEAVCTWGILPEGDGKALRDSLGAEGIFVGTFTQRRVDPFLLTRFDLKLIGNPSGRLIWSTKIETDHLAATANAKTIGTKVAEMAVESLKADLFGKPQKKGK
jgi:hypothetical protein